MGLSPHSGSRDHSDQDVAINAYGDIIVSALNAKIIKTISIGQAVLHIIIATCLNLKQTCFETCHIGLGASFFAKFIVLNDTSLGNSCHLIKACAYMSHHIHGHSKCEQLEKVFNVIYLTST